MTDSDQISIEEGCMQCLNYFGIFQYPLMLEEVCHYHPLPNSIDSIGNALENLLKDGRIYQLENYYSTKNDMSWLEERKKGKERALKVLAGAKKYISIVASFPFVRAVSISGSLSKLYASEEADIDYFIITEANRLWISRSLLHMFKKLSFLTGHQHYFCMNYFIDTEALTIMHRNSYSSIEMLTLLPVYNKSLNVEFLEANPWVSEFHPNHPGVSNYNYMVDTGKARGKRFFEFLINLICPKCLNRFLMSITDTKWRRKWRHAGYSEEEYNRAFQTEIHISKNHPVDYEKKVLNALKNMEENTVEA